MEIKHLYKSKPSKEQERKISIIRNNNSTHFENNANQEMISNATDNISYVRLIFDKYRKTKRGCDMNRLIKCYIDETIPKICKGTEDCSQISEKCSISNDYYDRKSVLKSNNSQIKLMKFLFNESKNFAVSKVERKYSSKSRNSFESSCYSCKPGLQFDGQIKDILPHIHKLKKCEKLLNFIIKEMETKSRRLKRQNELSQIPDFGFNDVLHGKSDGKRTINGDTESIVKHVLADLLDAEGSVSGVIFNKDHTEADTLFTENTDTILALTNKLAGYNFFQDSNNLKESLKHRVANQDKPASGAAYKSLSEIKKNIVNLIQDYDNFESVFEKNSEINIDCLMNETGASNLVSLDRLRTEEMNLIVECKDIDNFHLVGIEQSTLFLDNSFSFLTDTTLFSDSGKDRITRNRNEISTWIFEGSNSDSWTKSLNMLNVMPRDVYKEENDSDLPITTDTSSVSIVPYDTKIEMECVGKINNMESMLVRTIPQKVETNFTNNLHQYDEIDLKSQFMMGELNDPVPRLSVIDEEYSDLTT